MQDVTVDKPETCVGKQSGLQKTFKPSRFTGAQQIIQPLGVRRQICSLNFTVNRSESNLVKYNNGWPGATIQKFDIQNLKLLQPE